jgi:DNA polymerase Ligase (LigD)
MPRFVLLEHRWEGIHWDLMLERGAVLSTWAFDVPVIPDADLPARALPDHRRIYLEYQGDVSGDRGTVRRIDEGTYIPMIWEDDRIHLQMEGSQLVGEAELRQVGIRSDGARSWVFRLGKVD